MSWPEQGFVVAGPLSARWACATCGARGYPGGRWMKPHRRGHAACPACGRPITLKLDGTARRHNRCPRAAS